MACELLHSVKQLENYNAALRSPERAVLAKKIGKMILDSQPTEASSAIDSLIKVFFEVELRDPLKKTLSSVIQSVNSAQSLSKIHDNVIESMKSCLLNSNGNATTFEVEKLVAENILACLDSSFTIGQDAVYENIELVWEFLSKSLKHVQQTLQDSPSPQETADIFNACQQILKALSLCIHHTKKRNIIGNHQKHATTDVFKICDLLTWLLESDSTVLNCKLSAGIALANAINYVCPDTNIKIIFHGEELKPNINLVPQIPLKNLYSTKDISPVTELCLWAGLLACLSAEELIQLDGSDYLLFKVFPKLYLIGEYCNEDSCLLMAFSRALWSWTDKACQVLRLPNLPQAICNILTTDQNEILNQLYNYVWSNWDHFMDGVRFNAKGVFQNTLTIQLLIAKEGNKDFLSEMAERLLNLPWHCKGKYSALCYLVEVGGTEIMFQSKSNLVEEIIDAFSEGSLTSHLSDFFGALSKHHHDNCDAQTWENTWVRPTMLCLCNGDKTQIAAMQQYVLPQILKTHPQTLKYFSQNLSSTPTSEKETSLCVLITCIKTAKRCKVPYDISDVNSQSTGLWKNCISYDLLKLALCHIDEQVRLDALSIVADSPKTTELFCLQELNLLRFFIEHNLNIQSPAFRQKMIALLKKLFYRIKDGTALHSKKTYPESNSETNEPFLKNYTEFIKWLSVLLVSNLHPEANFPRRCTVLQILVILKEIFGVNLIVDGKLKGTETQLSINIDSYLSCSLFNLIRDTYENNKDYILIFLKSIPVGLLGLEDHKYFEEALNISFTLASSTRPPDSVTASYLFRTLADCTPCHQICSSKYDSSSNETSLSELAYFDLISVLLLKLEAELKIACLSLLEAASNGPLYGILACIRALFGDLKISLVGEESQWRRMVSRIVTICLEVGLVVQPVVCNSSPEGHLPMDTDPESINSLQAAIQRAIGRRVMVTPQNSSTSPEENENSDDLIADLMKTRAVSAQMLLLCSWRAHKEVSLLLGLLAEKCTIGKDGLLEEKHFLEMGAYFMNQLSEIKHRGAFEQAYVGFTKLCHRLWRSTDSELHCLPSKWLKDLLMMISDQNIQNDSTCLTRRSAGVPFIVQALLISEPEATNGKCFKEAMPSIIAMAGEKDTTEKSRIHALNVLRALYRDAHLGEEVMPFVAGGLEASILGFKCENWTIRNSATLLFTALITRIFGVNRSRVEPHKKNCLTGRVFFQRFPQLFEFLLSELKLAAKDLSTQRCSNLYPILLLLSRLYPSPMEGSSSFLKLASFVPLVEYCASNSPVWWTRQLASQALVPLLPIENRAKHLFQCFTSLTDLTIPQNTIHGHLLQVLHILRDNENVPLSISTEINLNISSWLSTTVWLLTSSNPCFATRCTYLEVVLCVSNMNLTCPENLERNILNSLSSIDLDTSVLFKSSECLYQAWCTKAAINVSMVNSGVNQNSKTKGMIETVLLTALKSHSYESHTVALDYLSWLLDCPPTAFESRSLDFAPFTKRFEWTCEPQLKKALSEQLGSSTEILKQMLLMAFEKDITPSCLSDLFIVLTKFPKSIQAQWTSKPMNLCQKLDLLLEKFQSNAFEDISVSILPFTGMLVLNIVQAATDNKSLNEETTKTLEKWSRVIFESSAAECSSSRRFAVTETLITCIKFYTCADLGHLRLPLWDTAVILLQDDEPEIRNQIVKLVCGIGNAINGENFFPYPVISSLSMELLLDHFLLSVGKNLPDHCLTMLLVWCLRKDYSSDPNENEEQPFDKGEMNVFCEEVTLARCASRKISQIITTFTENNKPTLTSLFWIANAINFDKLPSKNIENLILHCGSECERLVKEITQLDISHVFQSRLIDDLSISLYQNLLVIEKLLDFTGPDIMIKINFGDISQKLCSWKCVCSTAFLLDIQIILQKLSKPCTGF